MTDPNEINPKNTVAPKSDNILGGPNAVSLSDEAKNSIVDALASKLSSTGMKSNLGNVTVTIKGDGSGKYAPTKSASNITSSPSGASFISSSGMVTPVNAKPTPQTESSFASSVSSLEESVKSLNEIANKYVNAIPQEFSDAVAEGVASGFESVSQTDDSKETSVISDRAQKEFERLYETQEESLEKFKIAAGKMEESWRDISQLKSDIFKIEETGEGIDKLDDLRRQLDRAFIMNKFSSEEANAIQSEIKERQRTIDISLQSIADQAFIDVDVAKKQLGVTEDANDESASTLKKIKDRVSDDGKEFQSFVEQFKYENELTRKVEEEINSQLDKSINGAIQDLELFANKDALIEISKKSGLNLETLALVQEQIANDLKGAGDRIDMSDSKEVERFKLQLVSETKFKNDIIKELIKTREGINTESVRKELEEQYQRSGLPAAIATVRAKENADKEANQRRRVVDQQIELMKTQSETQKEQLSQTMFQSSLIEDDIKYRIEKEKEQSGIPKWYLDLKERLEPINAVLGDMLETFRGSGILTKILMILGLAGGIIAGVVSTAISKVFGVFSTLFPGVASGIAKLFAEGGLIGRIISPITKLFAPVADSMRFLTAGVQEGGLVMKLFGSILKPINAVVKSFGFGMKLGKGFVELLGKLALPLTIILTTIDAVIGGFKGYSKEGVSGIIKGALAGIISGLTFGLLDFESIFKFFGDTIQPIFNAINDAIAPFANWITSTYQIFKKAFDNIANTFQGGGSLVNKIFKSLGYLIVLGVEVLWNNIMFIGKQLLQLAIVLPFKISKFISETVISIIQTINEGVAYAIDWFVNWITSGEWLGDMEKFGNWIFDTLVGLLADAINGLADGLGELPIVGEYIKQSLGGGSKTVPPITQEEILSSRDAESKRTGTEIAKGFSDQLEEEKETTKNVASITLDKLIGTKQSNIQTLSRINEMSSTTESMANSYAAETKRIMAHEAMIMRSSSAMSNVTSMSDRSYSSSIGIEDSTKIKNISKELVNEIKTSENINATRGSLTSVNTTMVNNTTAPAPQPALIAPQPPRNTEPTYRNMMFMEHPGF